MGDNQDFSNEEITYLTEEGAAELRAELEELINVKRPELAVKLKEAIAMGDLSENADYHDAKEQQAFLEGRIQYLERLLRNAKIISDEDREKGVVTVGSEVTVQEDGQEPETYRIVGPAEANPAEGKISNESPLGRALLGKKVRSKVKVQTPDGDVIVFKVLKIR
ncbi:MAG: transcription elongation factor GreA [Phototrophicales bacterium]|nr:MAG: transcription elongation factor GreA [Phototrophicales bacterium]